MRRSLVMLVVALFALISACSGGKAAPDEAPKEVKVEETAPTPSVAESAPDAPDVEELPAGPKVQQARLPELVSDLYIGMPRTELEGVRDVGSFEEKINAEALLVYEQAIQSDEIASVTYQLTGAPGERVLYEIFVAYNDAERARQVAAELLGEPDAEGKWTISSGADFQIRCWVHENKLVYIDARKISGS